MKTKYVIGLILMFALGIFFLIGACGVYTSTVGNHHPSGFDSAPYWLKMTLNGAMWFLIAGFCVLGVFVCGLSLKRLLSGKTTPMMLA